MSHCVELSERALEVAVGEVTIAETETNTIGQLRWRLLVTRVFQQFDRRGVLAALAEQFRQLEACLGTQCRVAECIDQRPIHGPSLLLRRLQRYFRRGDRWRAELRRPRSHGFQYLAG